MRKTTIQQTALICATTPDKFEEQFNARMVELKGKKILDTSISIDNLMAIVLYEDELPEEPQTVREEYNAAGYVFLCKQCPHIELPKDKRLKSVACKYDEFGRTRLDCECCEMFYKELKQGSITPRYCR